MVLALMRGVFYSLCACAKRPRGVVYEMGQSLTANHN